MTALTVTRPRIGRYRRSKKERDPIRVPTSVAHQEGPKASIGLGRLNLEGLEQLFLTHHWVIVVLFNDLTLLRGWGEDVV